MLDNVVLVPAIQQRESAISKSERGKKTKHHLLTHIYGIRKKQTKKNQNGTDETICNARIETQT